MLAIHRAGHVFPVTPPMARKFIERGADPAQMHPAHDGIRRERFDNIPDQATARHEIGWPESAFIVGYVGRLHTMSMDKGVGLLLQAITQVEGVSLALVGGPDEMAAGLRQEWLDAGLPVARFLYAGQVAPVEVPRYQRAFDVCAMPFPWTEHFAYYASPIKLFEYMASGRALVASDLPAYADVVQDGDNALLVPPGDVDALAEALRMLRDDAELRMRLAVCAQERVLAHYTWDARAKMILGKVTGSSAK
jgi:glycosyltransferase involved in cell wall biosynthesis